MAYLRMIVEPRGQRVARSEEDGLAARGALSADESLRHDTHGVRVQIRDDKPQLINGPYAEAREMVGGFFLIDCATKDEAIAIAAPCPAARWATVEVREVAPCYVGLRIKSTARTACALSPCMAKGGEVQTFMGIFFKTATCRYFLSRVTQRFGRTWRT